MATFKMKYKHEVVGDYGYNSLTETQFNKFNVNLLDLGNISKEAKVSNALAVMFDLEGFTAFCSQLDPQLVVPEYLNEFLTWLFDELAKCFTKSKKDGRVIIWGGLPFFAKFTGDGVLLLWDTELCKGLAGIGNIVVSLREICDNYTEKFLPKASEAHSKPPNRLRVGVCRGQVLSIGDGNDYVGPCINMAARLQKIGALSFAISRRGFDPVKCFGADTAKAHLVKKTTIRGIGDDELIVILKEEYDKLTPQDKKLFK